MKVGFLHEKTSKSNEFTKKEILKKTGFHVLSKQWLGVKIEIISNSSLKGFNLVSYLIKLIKVSPPKKTSFS